MNTIKVPLINGLETMSFKELEIAMETQAPRAFVNIANWDEYPYTPAVTFSVARSQTHLAVLYHVRGLDLRAQAMEDHGHVWEDSCCEMFISHPTDGTYYNFEMTCIGTLLAAKRTGRDDAAFLSKEQMASIVRHTTLERKPYDLSGDIHSWSVAMCIPFALIGVDPESLPKRLRANFFKCGDETAHMHFLSWTRIEVPSPDFHRLEFFGTLEFE